jgi:hypothetical protein
MSLFSSSLRPKAWRTWHQQPCTAEFFPRGSYHTRGIERIEWPNYNLHATIHTKSVTVNRPNEICRHLYLSISAREHNQRFNIILCYVMFKNCSNHFKMTLVSPFVRKTRFCKQKVFRWRHNSMFIEFWIKKQTRLRPKFRDVCIIAVLYFISSFESIIYKYFFRNRAQFKFTVVEIDTYRMIPVPPLFTATCIRMHQRVAAREWVKMCLVCPGIYLFESAYFVDKAAFSTVSFAN